MSTESELGRLEAMMVSQIFPELRAAIRRLGQLEQAMVEMAEEFRQLRALVEPEASIPSSPDTSGSTSAAAQPGHRSVKRSRGSKDETAREGGSTRSHLRPVPAEPDAEARLEDESPTEGTVT
jgi:hypothetical protein